MSDEIPYEKKAFGFATVCKTIGVCSNTGLKLVRTGKLKTFRVGRRRLATGQAISDCQRLLEREQERTRVRLWPYPVSAER
jgi:hypothetical protein